MAQSAAATHLLDRVHAPGGEREHDCLGVVFFNGAGDEGAGGAKALPEGWSVMDRQRHCTLKARSPIRECDAFVIFDEARCR